MSYIQKVGGHIRPRYNKEGDLTYYQVCVYTGKSEINGKKKANYQYFSAPNEQQALELLEQKKAEATLHMARFANPSMMTVHEFIYNEYLPVFVNSLLKPSTQRAYADHAKYIDPIIGSIRLRDLTTIHLQSMFNKLLQASPLTGKPLSYRTVQDIKRFTSVLLKQAVALKYLYENPIEGTRLHKPATVVPLEDEKESIYTMKQLSSLLQGVKGTDMELPIVLLLDSGMRRGELCALTYDNIIWEKNTIRIVKNLTHGLDDRPIMVSPKTASSIRTVTLSPVTMELLKKSYTEYKKMKLAQGKDFKDTKAVIHKKDGDFIIPHSLYNKFKRTLVKLGLPPIKLHSMRSTCITLAIQEGAQVRAVADRVGHKDVTITQNIYLRCTKVMEDDATNVIGNIMKNLMAE